MDAQGAREAIDNMEILDRQALFGVLDIIWLGILHVLF